MRICADINLAFEAQGPSPAYVFFERIGSSDFFIFSTLSTLEPPP